MPHSTVKNQPVVIVQPQAGYEPRRDSRRPNSDKLSFFGEIHRLLAVSDKRSRVARARRRGIAIRSYIGPNGGGKTALMCSDVWPSLKAGRNVLSTVPLYIPGTRTPHPAYIPFRDLDQLLDIRDCDILMDEVVGVAGAADSTRLDPRIRTKLNQLRKENNTLSWSSPSWSHAAKTIRDVTQAVTECRGFYPDRRGVVAGINDAVQLWAPRRLFRASTFDTIDFDEWSAGKRDRIDPLIREWWYGPGSIAFDIYDTYDAVQRVAGFAEDGSCDTCGGTRPRRRCSCG